MTSELETLLTALADGATDPDRVEAARRAAAAWGLEDVEALFVDDVAGDAAVLLDVVAGGRDADVEAALTADPHAGDVADAVMAALFGADDAGVGEAVSTEAGRGPELAASHDPDALPVAQAVATEAGRGPDVARMHDPLALPIAAAIASEAGEVAIADAVLAAVAPVADDVLPDDAIASLVLDRALDTEAHRAAAERIARDPGLRAELSAFADLGRRIRQGVHDEAGEAPAAWRGVALAIGLDDPEAVPGWDEALLAKAIADEAGTVDVAPAVVGILEAEAKRFRDLGDPEAVPPLTAPANSGFWIGTAVVLAAAFVAAVGLELLTTQATTTPEGLVERRDVTFASIGEVDVQAVRYGDDTTVYVEPPVADDEDGTYIIWVDDEESL